MIKRCSADMTCPLQLHVRRIVVYDQRFSISHQTRPYSAIKGKPIEGRNRR